MNNPITSTLSLAWNGFFGLRKHRPEPAWARIAISTGIALVFFVLLFVVPSIFGGHLRDEPWWRENGPANLVFALSISYTIHALYRILELLMSEAAIRRIRSRHDWRTSVFYGVVGTGGALLGAAIGVALISLYSGVDVSGQLSPGFWPTFAGIAVLISVVNWFAWRLILRRKTLQLQLTEARLGLLQAQIEPHFLFNTLANVQSLMDADPPRARQMLEAFTDYLRASLASMREGESSLGAELETARHYLELLQIRMGERLGFAIEVPAAAMGIKLPPLLLQPLVENAIHHGLEPKLEGGQVLIHAEFDGERLRIRVDDNGRGLEAPKRPGRGLALANVRERLRTRFGETASLSLEPLAVGTRAVLDIPCSPQSR